MKTLIVSRHQATIDWLKSQGVTGEVVNHVTETDCEGAVIYGNVPLHLAALAKIVHMVQIPNLPAEKRGKDLTQEEIVSYGVKLQSFKVSEVE